MNIGIIVTPNHDIVFEGNKEDIKQLFLIFNRLKVKVEKPKIKGRELRIIVMDESAKI